MKGTTLGALRDRKNQWRILGSSTFEQVFFLPFSFFLKLRLIRGSAENVDWKRRAQLFVSWKATSLPVVQVSLDHVSHPGRADSETWEKAPTRAVSHHLSLHHCSHAAEKEHLVQIIYIALDMQLCRRWKMPVCSKEKKKTTIIDGARMKEGGEASLCDFSSLAEWCYIQVPQFKSLEKDGEWKDGSVK